MNFSVECAHLKNVTFLLKPNPYVELFLDNSLVKKTEVIKCTYQPKWNEQFTVYVSKLKNNNSMIYKHLTVKHKLKRKRLF